RGSQHEPLRRWVYRPSADDENTVAVSGRFQVIGFSAVGRSTVARPTDTIGRSHHQPMVARRRRWIRLLTHGEKPAATEENAVNDRQLARRHGRALLPSRSAGRSIDAALSARGPRLHRHKPAIAVGHPPDAVDGRSVQSSARPTHAVERVVKGVPRADEKTAAIGDITDHRTDVTFRPGIEQVGGATEANTEQ